MEDLKKKFNLTVDPYTLPEIKCTCGCSSWTSAFILKKLSKILSPDAKDGLIPIPDMICAKCKKSLRDIEAGNFLHR